MFHLDDEEEVTDDGPLEILDLVVNALHSLVRGMRRQVLSNRFPVFHQFPTKIGYTR